MRSSCLESSPTAITVVGGLFVTTLKLQDELVAGRIVQNESSSQSEPSRHSTTPRAQFLDSVFRIQPGESHLVLLMFVYLTGVVSAFIIGRTVRDTLFLHRVSLDTLPSMYVLVAGAVAFASWRYSFVADRYRRDRLIVASLAIFASVTLIFWGLIRYQVGGWVYVALYAAVEVIGAISVMQFWTLANDVFSGRQAKRLFGFIGAGAVIANVLCGFGISAVVSSIRPENLLLVAALMFAACIGLVRVIANHSRGELEVAVHRPRRSRIRLGADTERVFASKHLKIISALVVVTFLTVTVVDYQFKVLVRVHFENESALAMYFGYFYAFTGIVASAMQFLVTGRVLERSGIVVALSILPVAIVAGVTGILFVPLVSAIVAATIAKGAENVFRYTINDATMQLLYVPVPSNRRGRAKAFIDGILKPSSIAVAGLTLALLGRMMSAEALAFRMAYLDLALLGVWLVLIVGIKREYVKSLIETLRERRLDLTDRQSPIVDEGIHRLLQQRLQSQDEGEVLTTLEVLATVDLEAHPNLLKLLEHPSENVRIRTLELIGSAGLLESTPALYALCRDSSPKVRSAAITAVCAIGRDKAIRSVKRFLHDTDGLVRAAAVAAMIRHGGLDGILTAAETLKAFLASPNAEDRLHGARILRDIRVSNFFQPVMTLLHDEDPRVRVAAVEAAGAMKSAELVLPLIYKLADPVTAMSAVRALVAYGPRVERTLIKVLSNPLEDIRVRRRIPRILEHFGRPETFSRLLAVLDTKDPQLQTQIAKAAAHLRERHRFLEIDDHRVDRTVREQLRFAYQSLNVVLDLELTEDDLLAEALHARKQKHLAVVFGLLEIRYPSRTIQLVHANLASDNRTVRANALEVIDNLLSKEEARLLLPILESPSLKATVQKGQEAFLTARRPATAHLELLLNDPNPWIVACTLHHIGEKRLTHFLARVRNGLDSKDAIVRETAVVTVDRLVRAESDRPPTDTELQAQTERLTQDDVAEVRQAAERLLATLGWTPAPSV